MAEYEDLDSLIGKIQRAAIDVYMTDADNYYEIEGGRYRYRGSGRGVTQWCTRPGEDGSGGGDMSMDGMPDFIVNHLDDDYRGAFDDIRGQVDDIFGDLKSIPTGALLYYEETWSMEAAELLTPRGATAERPPGGGSSLNLNNPELSGRVNAIHGYSYRLSSRTINVFRDAYAHRIGAILDGQAALAATLGMAAAGQEAVFLKLRDDIATFATQALGSLEALAGEQVSTSGAGDSFAVGGALLSILGLVGGPGRAALAAAGTAGGLISDLWPEPPAKKEVSFSGSDLSSMMQSISEGRTPLLETAVNDETATADRGRRREGPRPPDERRRGNERLEPSRGDRHRPVRSLRGVQRALHRSCDADPQHRPGDDRRREQPDPRLAGLPGHRRRRAGRPRPGDEGGPARRAGRGPALRLTGPAAQTGLSLEWRA